MVKSLGTLRKTTLLIRPLTTNQGILLTKSSRESNSIVPKKGILTVFSLKYLTYKQCNQLKCGGILSIGSTRELNRHK